MCVTINYVPGLMKADCVAEDHLSHLWLISSEEAVGLPWFCLMRDSSLQQVCGTKWIHGIQGAVRGDVCASPLSIHTAPF